MPLPGNMTDKIRIDHTDDLWCPCKEATVCIKTPYNIENKPESKVKHSMSNLWFQLRFEGGQLARKAVVAYVVKKIIARMLEYTLLHAHINLMQNWHSKCQNDLSFESKHICTVVAALQGAFTESSHQSNTKLAFKMTKF